MPHSKILSQKKTWLTRQYPARAYTSLVVLVNWVNQLCISSFYTTHGTYGTLCDHLHSWINGTMCLYTIKTKIAENTKKFYLDYCIVSSHRINQILQEKVIILYDFQNSIGMLTWSVELNSKLVSMRYSDTHCTFLHWYSLRCEIQWRGLKFTPLWIFVLNHLLHFSIWYLYQ